MLTCQCIYPSHCCSQLFLLTWKLLSRTITFQPEPCFLILFGLRNRPIFKMYDTLYIFLSGRSCINATVWQNWPAKKHRHRLYIVQLFMQLLIHWQRNWRMCFSFMAVHCNVTNSTWTWKSISIAARYNDMREMNHLLVIVETKSRIYSQYFQNGNNNFVLDKKKCLIKCRNHTVNRVGQPKKHLALRPIAHLHISVDNLPIEAR